jgi:thiamine-phosphate pyrophosphorylase
MRKPLPKLMAIADPSEQNEDFLDNIEIALGAGVRLVQFRAKHLSADQQWNLGAEVAALCAAFGALMIVNDRCDVARAVAADGVHLPAHGLPVDAARRTVTDRLVGVSCHSTAEVILAEEDGADYVTLSPVFESASKPGYGPPLGLDVLRVTARASVIPIYALGGIDPLRATDCLNAGAYGIALMSGVFSGEIDRNVHKLLDVLRW